MDSNTQAPRYAGIPVTLNGKSYIVPPLSMPAARLLLPKIASLKSADGLPQPEHIDAVLEVALAAIQRNYPDITADELEELIDVTNIVPLFRAALGLAATSASPSTEASGR
jgi:hypothetical protein